MQRWSVETHTEEADVVKMLMAESWRVKSARTYFHYYIGKSI